MSVEIKVPILPESVAEATVATWHKQVGDAVSIDENIVDIETEKVVLETATTSAPAPAAETAAPTEEATEPSADDSDKLSLLARPKARPIRLRHLKQVSALNAVSQ